MAGLVRAGDKCSGHGSYPPRSTMTSSANVFVEGMGAVRMGDTWSPHCDLEAHISSQVGGSKKVYINSLPSARIGDAVACGSVCVEGSETVTAG